MSAYLTWGARLRSHQITTPVNFSYPAFFFSLITPQWVAQTQALSLWLYLRSAYGLVSFSAQSPLRGLSSFWERHRTASLRFTQAGFAAVHRPARRLTLSLAPVSPGLLDQVTAPCTFTFALPGLGARRPAWLRCSYGSDARCGQWLWFTNSTRHRSRRLSQPR